MGCGSRRWRGGEAAEGGGNGLVNLAGVGIVWEISQGKGRRGSLWGYLGEDKIKCSRWL